MLLQCIPLIKWCTGGRGSDFASRALTVMSSRPGPISAANGDAVTLAAVPLSCCCQRARRRHCLKAAKSRLDKEQAVLHVPPQRHRGDAMEGWCLVQSAGTSNLASKQQRVHAYRLHVTTQTEHQVQRGLLLDVVSRQGTAVVQLLANRHTEIITINKVLQTPARGTQAGKHKGTSRRTTAYRRR
jgi:hypothetical protein